MVCCFILLYLRKAFPGVLERTTALLSLSHTNNEVRCSPDSISILSYYSSTGPI